MTIILREQPDLTEIAECDPADAVLRVGMRLAHAVMPRSLDEDRHFIADLSETAWNGVRLSGVETPADIEKASALLRVAEANRDMPPSSLLIFAVLDTARAALGLDRFDRAIPRLAGFIFDANVLARASGAAADSDLVAHLRLRLPLAARASGVTAFLAASDDCPETMSNAAREGYGGLCVREA